MNDIKIHKYDKWVTDWSYYKGEEDLGKVRFVKSRFGLHFSVHESGERLITALELQPVIDMTYWHLKWKRDGYEGSQVNYDGEVGGKL